MKKNNEIRKNKLKAKLKAGDTVFGPFCKFSDPTAIEIAALAGFDFVIIDLEHGPLSIETAQHLVRAAELRSISPVIRVGENNASAILRALDIGTQSVQVPQISSRKNAQDMVDAARFHPQGERGVCRYVRNTNYTSSANSEYFDQANAETLGIIHIEGTAGIENLADILTVDGLDVIFLGPNDLSQSCGVPGQVDHPEVHKKMEEAVQCAKENNVCVGTFVDNVAAAQKWMNLGVQYISVSVDVGIYYKACLATVQELQKWK